MKKLLNCCLIIVFCISCSNSKHKKLLEDSFYVYESGNKAYENLSEKSYSLINEYSINDANNLIGAINLNSLDANKITKIKKIKDKYIISSNLIILDDWIYFLDTKNFLHKISIANPKNHKFIALPYKTESFSTLKKQLSYYDNNIVISFGINNVFNIDLQEFKIKWQKEVSNIIRSSTVVDNKNIYISTIDNVILALSNSDGSIIWKNELDSKNTSIYGSGYLSIIKNFLLFTSSLGETIVLDKRNGKIIWIDKINLNNIYASEYDLFDSELKPIIDSNNYISWNYSGNITSYNISNGIRNWLIKIRPITNLWLNNDMVFTVTIDQKIIALDKNNGKIIWFKDLAEYKKIKQEDFNEANISAIFILNKKLAILSKSGRILFVDPLNGEYLSKHRFVKNIISLPYLSNDSLFLQDKFGNIFKFN
jgi:outer membrane protein assembly factor BamB